GGRAALGAALDVRALDREAQARRPVHVHGLVHRLAAAPTARHRVRAGAGREAAAPSGARSARWTSATVLFALGRCRDRRCRARPRNDESATQVGLAAGSPLRQGRGTRLSHAAGARARHAAGGSRWWERRAMTTPDLARMLGEIGLMGAGYGLNAHAQAILAAVRDLSPDSPAPAAGTAGLVM